MNFEIFDFFRILAQDGLKWTTVFSNCDALIAVNSESLLPLTKKEIQFLG